MRYINRHYLSIYLSTTKKCQDYSAAITQLQGHFTKFISKLLYSSMQTSADGLSGQRQVSRMTDEIDETCLASECQK